MAGQPGDKYPVLKHREKCADLLHFHKTVAYSGYQLQLLGGHGLPLRPTLSELDRGIRETELLTFTSLSLTDFHRAHQLQLFDKITASTRAQLVNFTGTIRNLSGGGFDYSLLKRRYIRQLHALTLRHLLAKEWVKDPVLRRAYDPLADRLLLALCWPHHDRRSHKEEWCPLDSYRSRVTFREYFTAVENQVRRLYTVFLLHLVGWATGVDSHSAMVAASVTRGLALPCLCLVPVAIRTIR